MIVFIKAQFFQEIIKLWDCNIWKEQERNTTIIKPQKLRRESDIRHHLFRPPQLMHQGMQNNLVISIKLNSKLVTDPRPDQDSSPILMLFAKLDYGLKYLMKGKID